LAASRFLNASASINCHSDANARLTRNAVAMKAITPVLPNMITLAVVQTPQSDNGRQGLKTRKGLTKLSQPHEIVGFEAC
jgi:hypothetical protein